MSAMSDERLANLRAGLRLHPGEFGALGPAEARELIDEIDRRGKLIDAYKGANDLLAAELCECKALLAEVQP